MSSKIRTSPNTLAVFKKLFNENKGILRHIKLYKLFIFLQSFFIFVNTYIFTGLESMAMRFLLFSFLFLSRLQHRAEPRGRA